MAWALQGLRSNPELGVLSPAFLFPAPQECPPAPERAPAAATVLPPRMALAPDGTAHLLLADLFAVCWWSVTEDNEPSLRAVWPLPGPHPIAVWAGEVGVVLLGQTDDGLALTTVVPGRPARDVVLGGRGEVLRFEVEGEVARVSWLEAGRARFRRVNLGTGELVDLGAAAFRTEVADAAR